MDLSTHDHSRWTICRVAGEVDISTAPALHEHLLAALAGLGQEVLLDLSGVTFMDASGLRVLVLVNRLLQERGGTLHLLAPAPVICRLLEVTGLTGQFPVYSTSPGPPSPVIRRSTGVVPSGWGGPASCSGWR